MYLNMFTMYCGWCKVHLDLYRCWTEWLSNHFNCTYTV